MNDHIDKLILAWSALGLNDRSFWTEVGNCVNCTAIGKIVLGRLGIPGKPAVWDVYVYNEKAHPLMSNQVPVSEWPNDAWSIGITQDQPAEGGNISGHCVLEVDGGVLDLSAAQFHRPEHDLHCPGPVWIPPFKGEDAIVNRGNTFYSIMNRSSKLPRRVRKAPGLRAGHRGNLEIAESILKAMK